MTATANPSQALWKHGDLARIAQIVLGGDAARATVAVA